MDYSVKEDSMSTRTCLVTLTPLSLRLPHVSANLYAMRDPFVYIGMVELAIDYSGNIPNATLALVAS